MKADCPTCTNFTPLPADPRGAEGRCGSEYDGRRIYDFNAKNCYGFWYTRRETIEDDTEETAQLGHA